MTGKIKLVSDEFPGYGEALIYLVFEDSLKKDENLKLLNKKTGGKLTEKFKLYDFAGKEEEIVNLELNDFYKEIIIVGAGKSGQFSLAKWKKLLADALRTVQSRKLPSATVCYFKLLGKDFFEIGKSTALAFYLANYHFDFYKSEEERKKIKKIESLEFITTPNSTGAVEKRALGQGVEYGKLISRGIYLTRDLVNQPAASVHPETLVEEAFKIEKESGGKIKVEVLDEDECRRAGMGAFLAVGQGSERKPKFIILHYKDSATQFLSHESLPAKTRALESEKIALASSSNNKTICLIGKSITFDSGGLSLKPSESMETMKIDMAGGATVLGVFKILARLDEGVEADVYGILPACENMPSGGALKPGDIVTALNKKTIEVLNTDAEGRLTLADALAYAEKYIKPDIAIDIATLTGACMVALGKEITGMFGNNEPLAVLLEKIAKIEGEELWRLPLYQPYVKKLKSDVADLKNITGSKWGGAISAALFLAEFVKGTKWVHLDIAGPAFSEEVKGVTAKGGTGWGVVTLVDFLTNYVSVRHS